MYSRSIIKNYLCFCQDDISKRMYIYCKMFFFRQCSISNKKSRIYGTSDSFAKINLICQICQRVRSVRESDLWSVRPCGRPWESDLWGRSVRPWESDLWVRSASHAHRAMQSDPRGRLTDFTAKRIASPGVRERPIGLTDRTLKSVRPIGLSRTAGDAVRSSACVRGRSASQIGLSDWLRQITWQIVWGRVRKSSKLGNERPNSASHGLSRPLTASHALSDPVSSHLIGWERESEAVRGRIRPLIPQFWRFSNFRQQ